MFRIITNIILVTLIWGYTWVIIKMGLKEIPPFLFASLRLFIGAIPLFIIQWVRRKSWIPHKQDWKNIVIMSVLMSLGYMGLVTYGMQFVNSGVTSVLVYLMPIFVTILAHYFLRERLTILKIIGIVSGTIGILCILGSQIYHFDRDIFIGQILIILSALSWGSANIFSKVKFVNYDIIKMTSWQLLLGAIMLFGISSGIEPHQNIQWTTSGIVSLLFTGLFSTGFTFVAWFWVLGKIEASTASFTLMAVPILGLFFGWIQLNEPLSSNMLLGSFFICLGIFFGAYQSKTSKNACNINEIKHSH